MVEQSTCRSDICSLQLVSLSRAITCVCGGQKARLSRLQQSKLAARRAIAEGTRRFDEWQRTCGPRTVDTTTTSSDRRDAVVTRSSMNSSAGQPLGKKDLFELQHFHLLKCLEYTTVTPILHTETFLGTNVGSFPELF